MIQPSNDKRGKHTPKHAIGEEVKNAIDEHIESFHPSVSHYMGSHAPLRKYLVPELSPRIMYGYFKESHPGFTCSEVTYRRQILSKYISYCKVGEGV